MLKGVSRRRIVGVVPSTSEEHQFPTLSKHAMHPPPLLHVSQLGPWSRLLPPQPAHPRSQGWCALAEQQDARGIMPTIPYYATMRDKHGKDYHYEVRRAEH